MHRLFHDFNNLQRSKREGLVSAPLVCAGTKDDIARLGVALRDGMEVLLYEPDPGPDGSPDFLEVRAKIRYDADLKCFVGDFAWDDLKHRSEAEAKKK
jgi:hypothetical protein